MPSRGTVVAFVIAASVVASRCASLETRRAEQASLHNVRTVFVSRDLEAHEGHLPPPDSEARRLVTRASVIWKRRYDFLAEALARYGFVTTVNQSAADATVKLTAEEWVTLDGPAFDSPFRFPPNRYVVDVEAASLRIHWQTSVDAPTQDMRPKVERMYMESLASRLFKAWKQSALRAGDLTAARARSLKRIDGK